jgi:hypothetical protein
MNYIVSSFLYGNASLYNSSPTHRLCLIDKSGRTTPHSFLAFLRTLPFQSRDSTITTKPTEICAEPSVARLSLSGSSSSISTPTCSTPLSLSGTMASKPCKLFAQGTCRFGNKCKFQHDQSSGTSGASSSVARGGQGRPPATRTSSSGAAQSPTGSTSTNAPVGPVPRGACNTFWATNKCKFGNSCKYRHVFHGAPNVVVSAPTNAALKPLFEESVAAGDTGAQNGDAGSGADAYIVSNVGDVLGPADALSSLRRYMRDDYRFDKPPFIYGMMKVLTSATSGNKAWVRDVVVMIKLSR